MPAKKRPERNEHIDPKLKVLFENKLSDMAAIDRINKARDKQFGALDVDLAMGKKKKKK